MKILVTGGAGFIGSNVVDAYIEAGHDVVVVDDLSSGNRAYIHPKATFYECDIRSPELTTIMRNERPDVVNHHAAQKSVPKSVENPLLDVEMNAVAVLKLMTLCVEVGVQKFIYVSSGGALAGDAPHIPTDENVLPVMISPYAIHKYTGEKYLHFFQTVHGLNYTVLRYANVYGPRQIPDGECGVVPIFMNNILAGQPSRLFAYSDQPHGTTRDYVYVADVARANLLALTEGHNEIFNIGTGQEVSVEDVYRLISRVAEVRLPLERHAERVGDVRRSALDCSRAAEKLKWVAETPLEEGIRKTLSYIRAQQD